MNIFARVVSPDERGDGGNCKKPEPSSSSLNMELPNDAETCFYQKGKYEEAGFDTVSLDDDYDEEEGRGINQVHHQDHQQQACSRRDRPCWSPAPSRSSSRSSIPVIVRAQHFV